MKNVLEWLEATSERLPNKTAIADEVSSLTFAELKEHAQAYGTYLADKVAPRQAVAFYLEKSPEVLAAMFGTVYAGGFYSVIDTRHPASRVQAICETLQPALVIADEEHAERAHELFDESPWELVMLEDARAQARKNKDWKQSDELRAQLQQKGYIVEDTAQGQSVRRSIQ